MESLEKHRDKLRQWVETLGVEAKQGAVGLVIDRTYIEGVSR
jgi:hypothetical protein